MPTNNIPPSAYMTDLGEWRLAAERAWRADRNELPIEAAIRALDHALAALDRFHVDIEEVHAEVRIARRLLRGEDA